MNTNNGVNDFDVPDPYDFPTDPDGLRQLDSALRCNICSELYDAPVSLPCGHSFCSLCIRNSIETSEKSVCAQCRKDVALSQLRPVQVIEEVVAAWKLARSPLLDLIRERVRSHSVAVPSSPTKKRRLNSPEKDGDEPVAGPSKMSRSATSSSVAATPDFVDCPVCSDLIPMEIINEHLDSNCKVKSGPSKASKPKPKSRSDNKDTKKEQWSKLFDGGGGMKGKQKMQLDDDTDPLPKPTYHTMKDKQLKDLLVKYGLPVTGTRDVWVARHKQWVLLFNSNLDRSGSRRLTFEQLRSELSKWERQSSLLDPSKRAAKLKYDVEDSAAYAKAHKDQFDALVAAARSSAKPKQQSKSPPRSSSPEDADLRTSSPPSLS